jgi:hypothetical protein
LSSKPRRTRSRRARRSCYACRPTQTLQSPQPFHLDAAMARTAVRDGELRIALPDGTTYPVRIERQFTDETGHWNVVGRAQTKIGAQAMVLTLGANAVFGTLPMPDGTLMQITSGPDGVLVAPTGGIIPRARRRCRVTRISACRRRPMCRFHATPCLLRALRSGNASTAMRNRGPARSPSRGLRSPRPRRSIRRPWISTCSRFTARTW